MQDVTPTLFGEVTVVEEPVGVVFTADGARSRWWCWIVSLEFPPNVLHFIAAHPTGVTSACGAFLGEKWELIEWQCEATLSTLFSGCRPSWFLFARRSREEP